MMQFSFNQGDDVFSSGLVSVFSAGALVYVVLADQRYHKSERVDKVNIFPEWFKSSLLICNGTCKSPRLCKKLRQIGSGWSLCSTCCCMLWFVPQLSHFWVSVRQQHTHTHFICVLSSAVVSEENAGKREERRCFDSSLPSCCQSDGLHSCLEKKKGLCSRLWEFVRVERKWREVEKVKAKNEGNKERVQEEIDRAKQRKQIVVVVLWVS